MAGKGYTPKPWHLTPDVRAIWAGSSRVADIAPANGHNTANAHLIVTSPDTLEALEDLLASALAWADSVQYDRDADWDYNDEPVIVAARAAIAKARGE